MNELASAETTGDAAVLDHDTVDDYTIINSQGYRATKQALLKAVRDGSYKAESKDVEILVLIPSERAEKILFEHDLRDRQDGQHVQWLIRCQKAPNNVSRAPFECEGGTKSLGELLKALKLRCVAHFSKVPRI
jgi:hypothetical protein